jgi:hypothetical protein
MNATTETVEQEIQRKGLTAARVTPNDITENIASEHFFTAFDGAAPLGYFPAQLHATKVDVEVPMVVQTLKLLTFCVLVLRNGFTVHGSSACASPENFNAELGRRIAREDAIRQVWPLMGYALREKLSQGGAP